jgi:hypothetical protein
MNKDTALKMAIKFIEEITNAAGKYPYVDKTQLVSDSYKIALKLKEALNQPAQGIELEWYVKGWDDALKDKNT